jgi:hypothetical protein
VKANELICDQTICAPASTAARNALGSTEETQTCKFGKFQMK